jgi:predicted RecA/RadA family phage recombinase
MATNRVQNGRRIDVTLGGTVSSGDPIVVGNMVGVCLVDGVSGDVIAVAIMEVYNLPKLDAAVIVQGESVAFDVSAGANGEVDDENITPGAGDVSNFGIAFEGKGATTGETIAVLLTPGTGTVT